MHVVIFEGSQWKTFAPVALSRPVFMLASGMGTLLEKQLRYLPVTRLSLWVRPELEESTKQRIVPKLSVPTTVNQPLDDEPALLVSGRSLHLKQFTVPEEDTVSLEEGDIVSWARVRSPGLTHQDVFRRSEPWMALRKLPAGEAQSRIPSTLADLVHWNEDSLISDSTQLRGSPREVPAGPYHLVNKADVWVGKDVRLEPGCVLDATGGPVVIAEHAVIGANSVLRGPCYIGPYCNIRPVSIIRSGTSLGTMCKVGGEISNSIMFGYSNKTHDGYLGDSYVGKWVNLGAGTSVSNLKNTYGEIKVVLGTREMPTGRRKLGAVIGDHAKTAIGTRLIAGTYVGFCCQLGGSSIAPRFNPSLSFWTDRAHEPYRLDKAIEVITRVFAQQNRPWTAMDESILRSVAMTAPGVEGV